MPQGPPQAKRHHIAIKRVNPMIDERTVPYAALLLRVALGLLALAHAGLKVFALTVPGFVKYFAGLGLPPWFAYAIIAFEVLGGAALIVGVLTRWVALLFAGELAGTIVKVHAAMGFLFYNPRGGWEFPALWVVAAIALALIGDGPYALIRSWPTRLLTR
jgi:putative oxidoreductase